jgi:RNA polymerase sigma factor (sigma-70 family)
METEEVCTNRVPVTKEYLAMAISGKLNSRFSVEIPQNACMDSLYLSVEAMVYKLAKEYSITSNDDIQDLVSECTKKVFKVIKKYDASKARFTTWCYRVCQNQLRTRYGENKGSNSLIISMPDQEDGDRPIEPFRSYEMGLSADFKDALAYIKQRTNARGRQIVNELFGFDKDSGEYLLPERINFAEASRNLHMSSASISQFYHEKVIPVLSARFVHLFDESKSSSSI